MSQKNEKLRRQVEGLRREVNMLKLEQTWVENELIAGRDRWAVAEQKRARQARAEAREYHRAVRRLSALLGISIGAAILLGIKALSAPAAEVVTPYVPAAVVDNGRLPGDDTPATAPETAENELIEAALLARAVMIEECTVTHYDVCEVCCGKTDGITATGVQAAPYITVAVDPAVIPLGSDVLVDYGDGELHYYRADDTGAAVRGNRIDLCVESHAEAVALGRKTATVYWVEQEA